MSRERRRQACLVARCRIGNCGHKTLLIPICFQDELNFRRHFDATLGQSERGRLVRVSSGTTVDTRTSRPRSDCTTSLTGAIRLILNAH